MDDLISRQSVLNIFLYFDESKRLDMIKKLPSAQPEIIRCRDCKHYTEPNIEYCELYGAMILWNKDDFCSRGERREL